MKIPFDEEATLNYITIEEDLELSWFDRLIGFRRSKIFTTEELSKEYKGRLRIKDDSITFEPFKLNFIFLVIVGLIFTGLMINVLFHPKPDEGFSVFIPFIIFFILVGITGVIFDNKRNFKILLSKSGITIRDFHYKWDEIYKIYIIRRRKGKGYVYFIILALNTGLTDRYELTNLMEFGATDAKLSAYIEYYKHTA